MPTKKLNKAQELVAKWRRAEAKCKFCPFCGTSMFIRVLVQDYGYLVKCSTCNGSKSVITRNINHAVWEWNSRVADGDELAESLRHLLGILNQDVAPIGNDVLVNHAKRTLQKYEETKKLARRKKTR